MQKQKILENVRKLYKMWKAGELGGEYMPEDSNPHFEKSSKENYHYFTLPMALNYQRNSYKLWESAVATYNDEDTRFVLDVNEVLNHNEDEVRIALTKYKIALQQNKQTEIWIKLCKTIKEYFNGDIRNLFKVCDYDVNKIRNYIQVEHKKDFPYLSGNKICNYWLYVLYQYTDIKFKNLQDLTVAPDTHVVQATRKLGLISEEEFNKSDVQLIVIKRWNELLEGTEFCPIDIHTPLWLWSRNGFKENLMTIKTTDVWTEQYPNHYECFNGAFIDGIEEGNIPYDRYKVVLNCNCEISLNSNQIIIGNKHNAIVFYKNDAVVRLAVFTNKTDVLYCLKNALNQKLNNIKLKDLLAIKNIKEEVVDMKQTPVFNSNNGMEETDIGSCDRMVLLNCMLNGDYTESKTTFGNYDCNEYDFHSNIEILYHLKTDCELFEIPHKGAFINKTKTRAIIIQSHGSISLKDIGENNVN